MNYLICHFAVLFVMIHTNIRWLQSCYQVRTKCQSCILLELMWMNKTPMPKTRQNLLLQSKNFTYHYASQNTSIRLPLTSHQITIHNSLHVLRTKFVHYEWYKHQIVYTTSAAASSHADSERHSHLTIYLGLILRPGWLLWCTMHICIWNPSLVEICEVCQFCNEIQFRTRNASKDRW